MAAALAALFAMSLVAATLVSVSASTVKRAARAEQLAQMELSLESAILLAGAQVVDDPRRRKLSFETASETVTAGGREITVQVNWDHTRLDANLAPLPEIERYLASRKVDAALRSKIAAALQRSRAAGQPIRSFEQLELDASAEGCARRHLTLVAGMTQWPDGFEPPSQIGQPAPGSRLHLSAVDPQTRQALSTLVLITGDPQRPFRVMDWRRHTAGSGDPCHAS